MFNPATGLDSLIPRFMRQHIERGDPPLYNVKVPDYDRLPIDTFLVETQLGSSGALPQCAIRIVAPRVSQNYPRRYLTYGGRLLYVFWTGGKACRRLIEPKANSYRHVVLPDDPRHEQIAAFKVACDTRRQWTSSAVETKPTLLCRALHHWRAITRELATLNERN